MHTSITECRRYTTVNTSEAGRVNYAYRYAWSVVSISTPISHRGRRIQVMGSPNMN